MTETSTALDTERADLLAELTAARAALTAAVEGLTDAQAATRGTVSELTPGGLVKHVTAVEDGWRRYILDGPAAMDYTLPEGVSWDDIVGGTAAEYPAWMIEHQDNFRVLPGDTLAGLLAAYRETAARTDEVVATVPDLNRTHPRPDAPWAPGGGHQSIRRVVLHLIAETVQHAGHADILRESLDGKKAS